MPLLSIPLRLPPTPAFGINDKLVPTIQIVIDAVKVGELSPTSCLTVNELMRPKLCDQLAAVQKQEAGDQHWQRNS